MSWPDRIPLEPEQEQLFCRLVEASRSVPREDRESFMVVHQMGGRPIVQGNAFSEAVLGDDIDELASCGLLTATNYGSGGKLSGFRISGEALEYYGLLKGQHDEQAEQVEQDVIRYLEGAAFQAQYPSTFARWSEAARLLWKADTTDELSTIGHKCREALQEFATTLIQIHGVEGANPDKAKTRDRLSAVVNARRPELGDARSNLLDALFGYWTAAGDLVQRQEHAGQREGQALRWEDARRVVFQTAIVMFEVDRTLSTSATG